MRDDLYNIVRGYIENEINYIKRKEDCMSLDKCEIADLYMLGNMTDDDIYKVVDSILINYDLENAVDNMIHEITYG